MLQQLRLRARGKQLQQRPHVCQGTGWRGRHGRHHRGAGNWRQQVLEGSVCWRRDGGPRELCGTRPPGDVGNRRPLPPDIQRDRIGVPPVQARAAAWLHARAAGQPGRGDVPVHCVPPGQAAIHAHRLQRLSIGQRVLAGSGIPAASAPLPPGGLPGVHQADRPQPLPSPLCGADAVSVKRRDAESGADCAAPGTEHEARLDADGPQAVWHLRRGALHRRAHPRLRAHQAGDHRRRAHRLVHDREAR
mmetsp:Transcript_44835/g.133883  ORF Transcript_44835/g.133883 Transcript_44835/m.133883 type:complete len:247 (+) Transcript_44835:496-1236(+)